ncbi:NYN domain-containing protein [Rhodococcus fascians]|nr:NYN domain-containing protein [Rhodococcus fascians]MBY4418797.1 NYN domain-containing protein [Rhodococcus fascians]
MRVGVYIDGYNLYYGGKTVCHDEQSWKWLNPRVLADGAMRSQLDFARTKGWTPILSGWTGAQVSRVVYCTARVDAVQSPSAHTDQDKYLKALTNAGAVDWIEYGNYVSRVKYAPLALRQPNGRPELATADWPVMVQDSAGNKVDDARFLVSYWHNEEKGSDVNVASHLLIDLFAETIDAAIVVSNDSDLKLPVAHARTRIPVGILNPRGGPSAGDLRPDHHPGQGPHWNRGLTVPDYVGSQMPDSVGNVTKPQEW